MSFSCSAPVRELDVWRDCGISPASSDCVLTWKVRKTYYPHNNYSLVEIMNHSLSTQTHPSLFSSLHPIQSLPVSQACGLILGYEIRLSYSYGTAVLVNVSTARPRGQVVCDEMQCHFTSSIKDASSVSVSAYNAHGATAPSYLSMPVPGIFLPEKCCHNIYIFV